MSTDENQTPPEDQPIDVQSVIAAFEKILEAFPQDRLALDTLADAFDRLEDRPKAADYLRRLAKVIVADRDIPAVAPTVERLKGYENFPGIAEVRKELESLLVQEVAERLPKDQGPAAPRKPADITNEVSLAWELLQAGKLTQSEYSDVVQDLSENSSKRTSMPVSVMHVLADRNFKGLDKALAYVAKLSGCAPIALSSFDLNSEAYSLLPMDFMAHRGAIVFELMGQDALVALLNPIDKDLREDVQRIVKRTCHFFTSSAHDYDHALTAIRKQMAARAAAS